MRWRCRAARRGHHRALSQRHGHVGDGVEPEVAARARCAAKFQTRLGAGSAHRQPLLGARAHQPRRAHAAGEAHGRRRARLRPRPRARERPPRVRETQDDAPRQARARRRPPEAPQEVDEDEVVRVESDLVTLNFCVVDRASGRGLRVSRTTTSALRRRRRADGRTLRGGGARPSTSCSCIDLSGSTAQSHRHHPRRRAPLRRPPRARRIASPSSPSPARPQSSRR